MLKKSNRSSQLGTNSPESVKGRKEQGRVCLAEREVSGVRCELSLAIASSSLAAILMQVPNLT